jgi:hypothetical protein
MHPIIGFMEPNPDDPSLYDCTLIGGTANGEWLGGEIWQSVVLPESFTYDLYSPTGYVGKTIGGTFTLDENLIVQGPGAGRPSMYCEFAKPSGDLSSVFGISAPWNPIPRIAVKVDPHQPRFRQAMRTALTIAQPDVEEYCREAAGPDFQSGDVNLAVRPFRVTEALRVDLDGTGEEDVILTAIVGDDLDNEAQISTLIALLKGSSVIIIDDIDLMTQFLHDLEPVSPDVVFVLDADGDGLMEIVTESGCCDDSYCRFTTVYPDGSKAHYVFTTLRWSGR